MSVSVRKRRVQRGVIRPYLRATASGERWWWVALPRVGRKALGLRATETTREEALKVAVERFGAHDTPALQRASAPQSPAVTIEDLAALYHAAPHGWTPRTRHTIELRTVAFVEWMDKHDVTIPSQLSDSVLDLWRTERMTSVSRATVNRDECVARRMLAWGASQSPPLCDVTPLARRRPVREPSRPRRRVIHSPAQVARMVAWARSQGHTGWTLTAAVLESTGWRIDEARQADAGWITATGVRLSPAQGPASQAWTGKGYRVREVDLSAEALAVVRRWMLWRDTPHGKHPRAGLSERWFGRIADLAARATDVPATYRPHDARRRWVTEAVRRGVAISTVRDLVGHRDVQTTERYVCSYYDDARVITAPTVAAVTALSDSTK